MSATRYLGEENAIRLSVREICDLALVGVGPDLWNGRRDAIRAAVGAQIHRRLQDKLPPDARAEVPVEAEIARGGRNYRLRGRADAVLPGEPTTVEEIKSVTAKGFEKPGEYHVAQANLTAWLWTKMTGCSAVRVRMTLCRVPDGEVRSFDAEPSADELERFCTGLLDRIGYRVREAEERAKTRLPSIRNCRFPYSAVRESQDIMLRECYRDVRRGKRLFIQAPTGTGKTISALYPAVRTLGEGVCDKIFYLTAKTSTSREAYRAATDLFHAGAKVRTVVLTSREQICANPAAKADPAGVSRHCNPNDCPFARGYYDRVTDAIRGLLERQNGYPRKTVEETAHACRLCPYELQLDLSEFCDLIICDYNYVFDPSVFLRRYFDPDTRGAGKFVFLVDEAHNLADRARDMYSAELTLTDTRAIQGMLLAEHPEGKEMLAPVAALIRTLQGLKRLCGDTLTRGEDGIERGYYLNHGTIPSLRERLNGALECTESWSREHPDDPSAGELFRLTAKWRRFRTVAELFDSCFLSFVTVEGEEITAKLVCLDPSGVLGERLSLAEAAVLFSATLTPLDYFSDILGGGRSSVRVALPSPYDPANLCVAAVTGISTRYEDREKSVRKLTAVIAATVRARAGNYMVYFPSYDYLEKVLTAFCERYPGVTTVVQTRGMRGAEREAFLDSFRDDGVLRVGFCVLGGSFSEGVDLPGGRLIGVIVVGVGLPGLSNERNILRDYFETSRENGCGYDYAYTFPGMNRVLQAAGRVIRTDTDRGVVVLADDRYAEPRYTALFPEHWPNVRFAKTASELADITSDFWQKS